jgi:hypothetical protein
LDFNQKIPGANWQTQEQDPTHGGMRWTGPGRCARLDLPLDARSDVWLRFSVIRALTQATLDSLVVKVNDEPIFVDEHISNNGARIYEGYVSQAMLARQPGCTQITFEVEKTVKPSDVIAGSEDNRLLGIAVNWVEVEPALPLIKEVVDLKKLNRTQTTTLSELKDQNEAFEGKLQTQEKRLKALQSELDAIYHSRTWKVAQRLGTIYRGLKRIFGR